MARNIVWEKDRNPDCKDCKLWKSAQEVCLMGDGPVPCDYMIVGEAPGFREDEVGKPFAGKAGSLLDKLLREIDLPREEVYITNVVHCRPPDNRTPTSGEISSCEKYLDKEFKRVDPSYVLLLGATALKGVLGKTGITKNHGKIVKEDGIKYMPAFHPAYALRYPDKERLLAEDMDKFKRMSEGSIYRSGEINYRVIRDFDSFNRCIKDLRESKAVSFDLETTQLDPHGEKAEVNCLGMSTDNEEQWILPLQFDENNNRFKDDYQVQRKMLDFIKDILQDKKVIAQNGKFDNGWLREQYDLRFSQTFDTMLASHLLDENTPNGLKYLARRILKVPDYDIDSDAKTGDASPEVLYEYNAKDAYYTLKIYKYLKKELLKDKPLAKVFIHLVMPTSKALETVEQNGVYVDQKKFKKAEKKLTGELKEIEKDLAEYKEEVNWNSPQQVAEFLYEDLNLEIIETTPTGNPSTAEPVLKELSEYHEAVDKILEYRSVKKLHSSYIKGWRKRMHDGKLYPNYKLHGTVTYRLSCKDPNLQQTPRDPLIRSIIGGPPGYTFVEIDYSQVELRVAAMLSGDTAMKRVFQTGQDIHTKTAQNILGKRDIKKEERKMAKSVNFGFIYGMGHKKFQEYARNKFGVELTEREAQEYRQRFFETYNDLPDWHNKQRKIAKTNGQVRTLIGRLRRLPGVRSSNHAVKAEAERQAINSPVQSFASDLTLMSLIDIDKRYDNDKVMIVGQVHDALLFNIKNEVLYEKALEVKRIMEHPTLLDTFGLDLPVPLIADVEIGNWGIGEELDEKELKKRV